MWEDASDQRQLDLAIIHYQQAEYLADQAVQFRQQAAWWEAEARQEEQLANRLAYQVGKDWGPAPECQPPEDQRRKGHN